MISPRVLWRSINHYMWLTTPLSHLGQPAQSYSVKSILKASVCPCDFQVRAYIGNVSDFCQWHLNIRRCLLIFCPMRLWLYSSFCCSGQRLSFEISFGTSQSEFRAIPHSFYFEVKMTLHLEKTCLDTMLYDADRSLIFVFALFLVLLIDSI